MSYSFPNFEPGFCSMSCSNCCSWLAHRFLRGQVRWSGTPVSWRTFQFIVIQTFKGFTFEWSRNRYISGIPLIYPWFNNGWQFDIWFFCLFKFSLYILKILVHILLRPSLKDFEHNLASMWNEYNCMVVWNILWDWNKNYVFWWKRENAYSETLQLRKMVD